MADSEDEMIVESENGGDDSFDDEDGSGDDNGESTSDAKKESRRVYLPGHQMEENESLIFDPSAYHMLHDIHSGKLQQSVDRYTQFLTCITLCLLRVAMFELRRDRR